MLTMGVCTHGSFGGYRVNTGSGARRAAHSAPVGGRVCCGTFIYDDYRRAAAALTGPTLPAATRANAAKAALA
ncbi:MAG: hypothetical protein ACLSVD_14280 [Eggerthellaceae bacterium]